MDSSVKHFAEKALSDQGFFLDSNVDGIYWVNLDDPEKVPFSLRGRKFSLFDDALETLCSALMPHRVRDVVKKDVQSGRLSREEAYNRLLGLYDFYEKRGQEDELEAVADVLDSFDGWSPLKAAI